MNNTEREYSSTKKLTIFAIFSALVIVLQIWGSAIKIGMFSLNLVLIPIVLCGMMLGPLFGLLIGLVAGAVVLICGITGFDPFTLLLFNEQPVVISLVCLLKTGLAGLLSAYLFKIIGNKYVGSFVSSAIVPIVNTGLFIVGMLLINGTLLDLSLISEGSNALIAIITAFVGFNFFFELGVNLVFAPALYRLIKVLDKIKR